MTDDELRESAGCAIGTSLGLGLVAVSLAAVAMLLFAGGAVPIEKNRFDGAEAVAKVFRGGVAPFGLELTESSSFPTGEKLLRLQRVAEPEDATEPQSQGANLDPNELVLIEYGSNAAAGKLFGGGDDNQGFRGQRDSSSEAREASAKLIEWERDPATEWHTTIEADELEWSSWRADYRIERAFRIGGDTRDSVWINLSQKTRNLVLFALWPTNYIATKADALRVVRTVEMLAPDAGPTFETLATDREQR